MRRRSGVAEGLCIAGSGALLVSVFFHWVRRGPGSRLRGHELVDTIVALGREVPGVSSARLTVLWYLVPALGALGWIVVGVTGAASRWTRAVAVAALVTSSAAVFAFARLAHARNLGIGAILALGGAVSMLVGAVIATRDARRYAAK